MWDVGEISDPKRRRWLRRANIPSVYLGQMLRDLKPYARNAEVLEDVRAWIHAVRTGKVIHAQPQGLAFYGKPGHGKTALALAIVQDIIVGAWASELVGMWCPADAVSISSVYRPVLYMYYPEMLALAKQAMSGDVEAVALENAIFGRSRNPDEHVRIFILDDLGKEHLTKSGWAENYFDHLLRTRFYNGYTNIMTTNVDRNAWGSIYGESMDSFCDEAFLSIAIASRTGKDRRSG